MVGVTLGCEVHIIISVKRLLGFIYCLALQDTVVPYQTPRDQQGTSLSWRFSARSLIPGDDEIVESGLTSPTSDFLEKGEQNGSALGFLLIQARQLCNPWSLSSPRIK